jgi:hypothetical protein
MTAQVIDLLARRKDLSQFFTPFWVAERLVSKYFPSLDARDIVLEPSCGEGVFLKAIPSHVRAVGVEIDPLLTRYARQDTGREVIEGDFLTTPIDFTPTAVIGNPPFKARLIEKFLERIYLLLPEGGRAGFVLPAYVLQTSRTVHRLAEGWSLAAEILPRDVFPRLSKPLVFAMFSKDAARIMVGFALYSEAAGVRSLRAPYREALARSKGSAWRTVCSVALEQLGGRANLDEIYREIEGNRPTTNRFWREKIRQTVRVFTDDFRALGNGQYALVEERAAA